MGCLSMDNGVTGLSEEQDENEPSGDQEPGQDLRARTAEVEYVDTGLEPALPRNWHSQGSTMSNSLEVHCTDCREKKEALSLGHRSLCGQCTKLRWEQKQAVLEFIHTEASYGEDLRTIKEQFQLPMQSARLLNPGQLLVVFSNIQELMELIDLNERFLESLQQEIAQALSQGDDDLMTVCIGEIFLEYVNMLPAFRTYCLQQASSISTLSTLEKEKELLRIFLHASQTDNTALRRMNLRSFLMAPLQRITKYPLLLSRITQATATFHPDYSCLCEATSHLASYLEHINRKARQDGSLPWALGPFRQNVWHLHEPAAAIDRRELAMKTLGWPWEETCFVMEGGLQLAQPPDGPWTRKGSRTLKFQTLQVILMARLQRPAESGARHGVPGQGPVGDAALVLIRDKNHGKLSLLRSPIRLRHCVVSADTICKTFELLEIQQGAFILHDDDYAHTQLWLHHIRGYARQLGSWKRRRNALPNIMISIPSHT
ncbi:rho guanine nucleotide exchange factor 38-like [Vombatus ursinus]|uniref:rho guanine nucleotide exchange factor 38-like n=1 Tax=Vombatus ursinus TaxID=29139 RepID=UPI000FFD0DF3|nr:rho guanine nucleotide exchange factor 38-like [Vombatus ursinus]